MLVILGPTSTGKTDIALLLARKLNGEIVSADSRQLYKYLDLGSGKMPGNESGITNQVSRESSYWIINGVKIWMYDVVNPEDKFNLYEYILKASAIISKILDSGKLPILTGGTGLYIRSLIEGVSDLGAAENKELREELENLEIEEIKKRINALNPEILKTLNNSEINNKRRLIRKLEKLTTEKNAKKQFKGIGNDLDILKIGLTANREVLSEKIKKRVKKRLEEGMIEESEELLKKGILSYERMEELGLEYRYIAKYLRGEIQSIEDLEDILSLKIKQFAKRQETWFKKETNAVWIDITDPNYLSKLEKLSLNWYNT